MSDIRDILAKLRGYFNDVQIGPPARISSMSDLTGKIPNAPSELLDFYHVCDGIRVSIEDEVVGWIYSIQE